ncbi:uncharacterized protein LOC117166837 isoform X2 [Belonocnema kinseyi]|uniref:uncharacterized protein LOC117166837 isoform X2 n=1 Tax=Belonocnema kinseyi TaxID=2817044 RepID=UPI00143D6070|nr:uncharacterized protein LOC117166837 isoform X2 [Belonocnema kinseyi]
MSKDAPEANAAEKADGSDHIFEDRGPKTIIRLVTVGAYMFSVSCIAVSLSGYYIFLWHPPNSRLIHAHAAHLRADSDMDFLVADSLPEFRVNKSHRYGHGNALEENEINKRYEYISNPIGVTENNRFNHLKNDRDVKVMVQSDEELNRSETHAKSKRLHDGRNNFVTKVSSKNIPTSMDKENDPQLNFSINRIFSNDRTTILKPSQKQLSEEDLKNSRRESVDSNSENMRIHKKFFKIL